MGDKYPEVRARPRAHMWTNLWLVAATLLPAASSLAVTAPEAPATSTGSYTVSYTSCGGCYLHWLEEKSAAGTWVSIGSHTVHFTDKPDGLYEYRAALLYGSSGSNYQLDYSATATVVVGDNLPRADELAAQFDYRYAVRVGYYDSDSRPDLFVERTAGGDRRNGSIHRLILRRVSGGFRPLVATSSTARVARTWPLAAVRVGLHDVNLDGYVDLLISGIGNLPGLSGTPGQIVLAPGIVTVGTPKAVVPVGPALRDLGADLGRYLADPDYFWANAPFQVVTTTYYDHSCSYSDFDYWLGVDYCYPYPITTTVLVRDYSGFSADAVEIWRREQEIVSGEISRSDGYGGIELIVADSLGTVIEDPALERLLGEAADTVPSTLERGVELFSALAGIGNAVAQESEGAGDGTNVPDRVLLTGRRIIGFGPFHTALQYGTTTVSAYDDDPRALYDGTLVSQVNWPPDHPTLTMRLGDVGAPLPPPLYWQRLLAADGRYGDDLRYDAIPSLGAGGFNSNGYVAGIVRATGGVTSVPMQEFVGGERPVPHAEFD